MSIQLITKYFPQLSTLQLIQFGQLQSLYEDWNAKINVISRKDIVNLYEHHVLHSLSIAKFIAFRDGCRIMDVGTGGGFPGIPLAILYPQCQFILIDSIGKKIRVVQEVSYSIGLRNVTVKHENVKEEKEKFDFVVSRAVMNAAELTSLVRKNILPINNHIIPNGLICLKGGDLVEEGSLAVQYERNVIADRYQIADISNWFDESFFETKKILYIPLSK